MQALAWWILGLACGCLATSFNQRWSERKHFKLLEDNYERGDK